MCLNVYRKLILIVFVGFISMSCSKNQRKEKKSTKKNIIDEKKVSNSVKKKDGKTHNVLKPLTKEQLRALRPSIPKQYASKYEWYEESVTINLVNKTSQITWLLFSKKEKNKKNTQSAALHLRLDDYKAYPNRWKAFTGKTLGYPSVSVKDSFLQIKVGFIRVSINGPGLDCNDRDCRQFANDSIFIRFIKQLDLKMIENMDKFK